LIGIILDLNRDRLDDFHNFSEDKDQAANHGGIIQKRMEQNVTFCDKPM